MNSANRKIWIAVLLIVTAVVLVAGSALIAVLFFRPAAGFLGPMRGTFPGPARNQSNFPGQFDSNGEQIYWTGTSQSGPPITAEMTGMHRMPQGMLACVNCHGEDGSGGRVQMMMETFTAPNIQFSELTGEHGGEHEEHEPYTEETIKRAITQGVDPAGESLEWMMPRWDMTDQQLNDLIAYLKTLE